MTELKENVAGTEESEFSDLDLNRVDKALKTVGIDMKDATGQFRNFDDVLMELSSKWEGLERNSQRYLATIIAGSRQQSRLIALLDDYERNVELMDLAADSTGQADKQFEKYRDTVEYGLNQLATKWEALRASILDEETIKKGLNVGSELLTKVNNLDSQKALAIAPFAIIMAKTFVKTFMQNVQDSLTAGQSGWRLIGQTLSKKLASSSAKMIGSYDFRVAAQDKKTKKVEGKTEQINSLKQEENLIKNNNQQLKQQQLLHLKNQSAIEKELGQLRTEAFLLEKQNPTLQQKNNLEEQIRVKEQELNWEKREQDNIEQKLKENNQQLLNNTQAQVNAQKELTKIESNQRGMKVANFLEGHGGIETIVSGVGAGLNQVMGPLSIFTSMVISGADAVDSLTTAFTMLAAQGISSVIPTLKSIAKSQMLQAQKAQLASQATEQGLVVKGKEIVAAEGATLAKEQEALAHEYNTIAMEEETAAALALEAVISFGVMAVIAGLIWAAKEGIEAAKEAREEVLAATTTGQAQQNIEDATARLEVLSEELSEVSEKVNELKSNLDLLNQIEDFNKIYLDDEELKKWQELQAKIAEIYPELISGYDAEGNAIIDIAAAWEKATLAKKEYYGEALVESEKSYEAAQEELNVARNQKNTKWAGYNYADRIREFAQGLQGATEYKSLDFLRTPLVYITDANGPVIKDGKVIEYMGGLEDEKSAESPAALHNNPLSFMRAIHDSSAEAFSAYMTVFQDALVEEGRTEFKDLNTTEVYDKLNDYIKDQSFITSDSWKNVLDKLASEDYLENRLNEAQQELQRKQAALDKAHLKLVRSVLVDRYGEDFTEADKAVQDLYVARFNEITKEKTDVGDIESSIGKNLGEYSDYDVQIYLDALETYNNDIAAQYKYLKDNLGKDSQLFNDFVLARKGALDSLKGQSESLLEALNIDFTEDNIEDNGEIVGITGDSKDIIDYYNSLGSSAKIAFLQGFNDAIKKDPAAAKDYYNDFAGLLNQFNFSETALNYIGSFEFSGINSINEAEKRGEFVRYLQSYSDLTRDEVIKLYDDLLSLTEKSPIFEKIIPDANTVRQNLSTILADIEKAFSSNNKVLNKYAGYSNDAIISLTNTEAKEIKALMDDLDEAGIKNLSGVLTGEENNWHFDKGQLINAVSPYVDQIDAMLQISDLTDEEINSLNLLKNTLTANLGLWHSTEDTIENISKLVSSFSSAAKEQLDQGYLSADTIQSLLDNAKSAQLNSDYIAKNFINEKSQLDYKGLYDYYNEQINLLESTLKLNEADQEHLTILRALKKDLWASMQSIESQEEEVDKVAEAWEKYNDQLKTVQEKQKAVNEEIEKMGEILYGTENRVSGLDSLYNYEQKISHFNNEIARSKELLSDAGTTEEATDALLKYSEATHDALKYEKARQETIRQGLADRAAQLENFAYSYSSEYGGASFRFGDYVRKDSATGLYTLNQTLLDRANFNDKFKQLLEGQVEEYNKYAEELLSSEDTVRKLEKEFQDQRAAAVKAYTSMEKNIADALKANYQEEVDDLKDKYDSMKEADDDYLDALQDAIDKQRKLRERENKYEDLAKKEKKLSLISRDTSGANELQRRQLEEEIESDRENLLDEAIDDVIDGMQKLYEEQEENRQVEIELKEALIDNTEYWYNQAEGFAQSFQTAEDYMEFMSELDKEFANSTMAMREDQLNTWREEYQGAIQYTSIQAMDATSSTGDFIVDTVNITGDEIAAAVSETSSSFVSEITNAYSAATKEFTDEMDKQIDSINKAKDALEEAVKKLQEYADEARKLENERKYTPSPIDGDNSIADYTPPSNTDYSIANPEAPTGGDNSQTVPPQVIEIKKAAGQLGFPDSNFKTWGELGDAVMRNDKPTDEKKANMKSFIVEWDDYYTDVKAFNGWTFEKLQKTVMDIINDKATKKYKMGGLVDYTGPAWVDGTKSAPEAFLNPEDTRRIGEAARILSDLPIFNSAGDSINTVSNTTGDISIEVNINVDKLSSEIDVNEMVNRVKDEIVSVARPVGTNVILSQNL